MSMYKKMGAAAILLTSLSGCSSNQPAPDLQVHSKSDVNALKQFERLSVEMVHEMRLWAKAKEAQSRDVLSDKQIEQRFFQSTHIPDGFKKEVTFSFYGSARKAVEAIALSAGYDFEVAGSALSKGDPMVDINLRNERLVEALYEAGTATGDTVTIEVLEASTNGGKPKIIYRYKE